MLLRDRDANQNESFIWLAILAGVLKSNNLNINDLQREWVWICSI
jgi:hypothetical protein